MIFSKQLRSRDHTRQFVVDDAHDRGWEVREEQDHLVVKQTWVHDWHRVEKAMMRFAFEAVQLQRAGWVEVRSARLPPPRKAPADHRSLGEGG